MVKSLRGYQMTIVDHAAVTGSAVYQRRLPSGMSLEPLAVQAKTVSPMSTVVEVDGRAEESRKDEKAG